MYSFCYPSITSPVRFGEGNSLQVRTATDGRFLPVCNQGWDNNEAMQICKQQGFRKYGITTLPCLLLS